MGCKVYFVGSTPPPLGGVTVFNKRKIAYLISQGVTVVHVRPGFKGFFRLFFARFDRSFIVYLSAGSVWGSFLLLVLGMAGNTIFYDHNSSRNFCREKGFFRIVRASFLRKVKEVVLVSEHLREGYNQFDFFNEINFSVESAFIPPDLSDEESIVRGYSDRLRELMSSSARQFVIASAFRPNLDSSGRDIYGLMDVLDAFNKLCDEFPGSIFLLAIAEFSRDGFSEQVKSFVERKLLCKRNFYLLDGQKELWPLFIKSKLFIRPTITDGDAVSVREALYLGSAVLASNVVPRPAGAHLYDPALDGLYDAIRKLL